MRPQVIVRQAACTSCGVCVESCPTDVLRMADGGSPDRVRVAYPEDCQACFLCVFDCPREAIRLELIK